MSSDCVREVQRSFYLEEASNCREAKGVYEGPYAVKSTQVQPPSQCGGHLCGQVQDRVSEITSELLQE